VVREYSKYIAVGFENNVIRIFQRNL